MFSNDVTCNVDRLYHTKSQVLMDPQLFVVLQFMHMQVLLSHMFVVSCSIANVTISLFGIFAFIFQVKWNTN